MIMQQAQIKKEKAFAIGIEANQVIDLQQDKPARIHKGTEGVLDILANISSGFSIQASSTNNSSKYAAKMNITSQPGIEAGDIIFPETINSHDDALGTDIRIYAERVDLQIPVSISENLEPGRYVIGGQIFYQASNDKICFMPQYKAFQLQIDVL